MKNPQTLLIYYKEGLFFKKINLKIILKLY